VKTPTKINKRPSFKNVIFSGKEKYSLGSSYVKINTEPERKFIILE